MLNPMKKFSGKIYFSYDSDCDSLDSYIKKSVPIKSIEMGDGILIHINPKSQKIVGFTVHHYLRRIQDGILTKIPYFEKLKLPLFK